MESMISPAKHEVEGSSAMDKFSILLKKLWKSSATLVVFSATLMVSMLAVALWVLYVGNPLVRQPDNIWGIRFALVVIALSLVLAERFLGKNKHNEDQ